VTGEKGGRRAVESLRGIIGKEKRSNPYVRRKRGLQAQGGTRQTSTQGRLYRSRPREPPSVRRYEKGKTSKIRRKGEKKDRPRSTTKRRRFEARAIQKAKKLKAKPNHARTRNKGGRSFKKGKTGKGPGQKPKLVGGTRKPVDTNRIDKYFFKKRSKKERVEERRNPGRRGGGEAVIPTIWCQRREGQDGRTGGKSQDRGWSQQICRGAETLRRRGSFLSTYETRNEVLLWG